jgi:hypothetical protein
MLRRVLRRVKQRRYELRSSDSYCCRVPNGGKVRGAIHLDGMDDCAFTSAVLNTPQLGDSVFSPGPKAACISGPTAP